MFAEVVVLTYQSPKIGSYTYKIPKNLEKKLKSGQLVNVPFGNRQPLGVVIAKSKKPRKNGEIKEISEIYLEEPVLLPYQLELVKWLSFYYIAPMVNCLETVLPPIPKRIKPYDFHGKMVPQTLVLVPSLNRLPETLAKFPKAKNYVLYHNQLKNSQRFEAWRKIKSGIADYVFGSRSAIFSPLPNLKKIIIFDEHDHAYKDERSPYFDTLTVADKIKELTKCELEIIDSSPKISTYYSHKKDIKPETTKSGINVEIISMAQEKKMGNYSPLAQSLVKKIREKLEKKESILLFLNRKAETGNIYCKNCGYQAFLRSKPVRCPNCSSLQFWYYSLNINSLASIVRSFVGNIPLNLISEETRNSPNMSQIDIATSSIFYSTNLKKYGLVGYVSLDSLVNIPDFSSAENLFSQISDLKKLLTPNGFLVLQTHNPQNPAVENSRTGNYREFFKSEIEQRQSLSYPPFSVLFKLMIKGKKSEIIEARAKETAQKLKEELTERQITVLGPYLSVFWQPTGLYNIILKRPIKNHSLQEREKAVKEVSKNLENLQRDWQIKVDPDSLN